MFLIPRRQIWTQQPQALTGIDRSDSITRDLCFVQSGGLADIFTNVGTTQKPTTRGVVRSFDAALSQYLFANNKQVVGPALTLFALFSVNNLTGNLALISVGGPASSRHILYVAPDGIAALFSGEGVPYGQAQSATGMLSDTAQYYFSVGRVSANNSRDIWVNGIQVASDSTSVAVSPANIDRVAIGAYWNNGAPVAGTYFDGNIALSGAYSRALSDDEIVVLSANPWKIFKRPDSRIFVPVSAGGSTLNASASGTAQAGGTASLAAQIALAAVGVSTASGAANASGSSNIPLSATGLVVSSGVANPSATITISAAGLAQAAGQAGLNAAVLLAGAGAAQAAGNAALATQLNALASGAAQATGTANLSGGAPGALAAIGQAQANGSAVLSVSINLVATGGAQASGTATGAASAPGALSAAGTVQAGASATLSASISLTAAGFVQAMATGQLQVTLPLAAFAPLRMRASHSPLTHFALSAGRHCTLSHEVFHG